MRKTFFFVVVTLGAWQLLAMLSTNTLHMLTPADVFLHSLPSLATFAQREDDFGAAFQLLLTHSLITTGRILVGLAVGSIAGILVGVSIQSIPWARQGNALVLSLIRAVPLFALIPLFLYWFGGTELSVYAYISFGVFVVTATNAYEAFSNVAPNYLIQARLLGASDLQVVQTVLLSAIQPEMAASFRTVVGLAWAFSLGAEYLSSTSGLGYLVFQSYLYADIGKLLVLATVYGCYGIVSFAICDQIFRRVLRWHGAF